MGQTGRLRRNNITNICERVMDITPSDSTDLDYDVLIYVGGAGNVRVKAANGTTVTFKGLNAGQLLPSSGNPVVVRRVYSTGTTATNIIGVW